MNKTLFLAAILVVATSLMSARDEPAADSMMTPDWTDWSNRSRPMSHGDTQYATDTLHCLLLNSVTRDKLCAVRG